MIKKKLCEILGEGQSHIRCLLDGDRLQDDLTCQENGIHDQDEIDIFHEMVGGSAESKQEEVIRKMLEELDSDVDTESEDSDGQEESASQEELILRYQDSPTCSQDLGNNKYQTQKKESVIQKFVKSKEVLSSQHDLIQKGDLPNQEDTKTQCKGNSVIVKTSENEDDSDWEDNTETEDVLINNDSKWYREIKKQYEEGKLKLCRSKPMDAKLMDLLEAKDIQQCEILRLRNIFSLREQHIAWENGSKNSSIDSLLNTPNQNRDKKRKYQQMTENSGENTTPFKRANILQKFGLNSPSPLIKKAPISEKEMKSISVAVHLWAERKMGGIKFLQSTRLVNAHFEDILKFTGPTSKWNLIKNMTVPRIRSLWRNTFNGIHYYRGHHKTGLENEAQQHDPVAPFCPFGHCQGGVMSPIDMDLVILTPRSKPGESLQNQNPLLNRNLFGSAKIEESADSDTEVGCRAELTSADSEKGTELVCETMVPFKYSDKDPEVSFKAGVPFSDSAKGSEIVNYSGAPDINQKRKHQKVERFGADRTSAFAKEPEVGNEADVSLADFDKQPELVCEAGVPLKCLARDKGEGLKAGVPFADSFEGSAIVNESGAPGVALKAGVPFSDSIELSEVVSASEAPDFNQNQKQQEVERIKKYRVRKYQEKLHQDDMEMSPKNSKREEDIETQEEGNCEPMFECQVEACMKVFSTLNGLEKHNVEKHPTFKLVKSEIECKICFKSVKYLDKHMKAKHSDLQEAPVCEICMKEIHADMKKHRKHCINCIYCGYENAKKARLINHMNLCDKKPREHFMKNVEPLDLSSPLKTPVRQCVNENPNSESKEPVSSLKEKNNTNKETEKEKKGKITYKKTSCKNDEESDDLERGRLSYPMDMDTTDEDYYSEFDIDDSDAFTRDRRATKDAIEVRLREIDSLENEEIEGDSIIVEKFIEFMRNKIHKDENCEDFSRITEPSTIKCYAGVLRNDILKAFHKLCSPFDARWLLDCKTPKHCTFDGEERLHVTNEEPIYVTSRVLEESLRRYNKSSNAGTKKKQIIGTFKQLMDFIELHFTLKLNAFGIEVLNRVIAYHKGVQTFIKGTSQWKSCNIEEKQAYEKNRMLKDYQNPHKDIEVLEKYRDYVKSEDRLSKINRLLSFVSPDDPTPSQSVMTELGTFVMEEIIGCTGCRPKVVRHLNMGAYTDKKPGFNPRCTEGEDSELEESYQGEKIFRRVDPNLPPKDKACRHQIEAKSAVCSENCEDQCKPDGYNVWVSWDKTQNTNGPYYLHLPKPIKDMMDRYHIIRSKFFKGKKSRFSSAEAWLDADTTPLFLNSAAGPFNSLKLTRLSASLGIDVTSYAFRKIVSTWALTHKCEDIRNAETEALQHSLKVAKERYLQSKQVEPQNLTQTYAKEENLFPERFKTMLDKDKNVVNKIIIPKEAERVKERHKRLLAEKSKTKNLHFLNKPLGPRQRILESDRIEFCDALEEVTGNCIDDLLFNLKPLQWRDFIVRIICTSAGENGDKMRRLWDKMYQGDLRFGIRDVRREAKESNWPLRNQNPGRRDRNSWIANSLRRSCLAANKFSEPSKCEFE